MMNESSSSKVVRGRISSLPDELLVSILSKLSIKEAARTSILSHSWEKLWILYEGNLEFDVTNKLRNVAKSDWPQIKHDFLKPMNRVLRTLLGSSPSLNSLIFRFCYLKTDMIEFDFHTIVEFVMTKRIRILDFDMYPVPTPVDNFYFSFPVEFFAWIKQPRGLHNISGFTSLSFKNVRLSDDTIHYFVSNCPLLERLRIQITDLVFNLRIIGDVSLKLKYLEILGVREMKSLVLSAPNLVSLYYVGAREIKLDVLNAPKLVNVCIGLHIISYLSGSLSTYLAKIHTLKLYWKNILDMNFSLLTPPNNVVFSNLKHLVFGFTINKENESLLGFTSSMVEASPMLEKFTLVPMNLIDDDKVGLHKMTTTASRKQYPQNQRLKVVELMRFKGVTPEVELLVYFVENYSSSLERIIINTSTVMETPCEILQLRKERGRQLMKLIPPGVDFVLI